MSDHIICSPWQFRTTICNFVKVLPPTFSVVSLSISPSSASFTLIPSHNKVLYCLIYSSLLFMSPRLRLSRHLGRRTYYAVVLQGEWLVCCTIKLYLYWDSNHRPTACYLLDIGSFKCDNNAVSLTSHRLDRDSESKDTATVVGSESLDLGARYMIS